MSWLSILLYVDMYVLNLSVINKVTMRLHDTAMAHVNKMRSVDHYTQLWKCRR